MENLKKKVLDKLADESEIGTTWKNWKAGENALIKEGLKQAIQTKDVERAVVLAIEECGKEVDETVLYCKGKYAVNPVMKGNIDKYFNHLRKRLGAKKEAGK